MIFQTTFGIPAVKANNFATLIMYIMKKLVFLFLLFPFITKGQTRYYSYLY